MIEYRGVDNLVYALVTADTEAEYTTGEVKILAPVAEVSKTIAQSQATSFYDNRPMVVIQGRGSDTITLTTAVLDLETLAEITGQQFDATTGAVIEGPVTPTYLALGYRFKGADDGSYQYVWRYKGSVSIPDDTSGTENDGTDTWNYSVIYTGISTVHQFTSTGSGANGIVVRDSDGKADVSDWFADVVTPDTIKAATPGPAVTVPVAPVITNGTASTGQPILNWSSVAGAASYSIYRADGSATPTGPALVTGIIATTWTDTSAVAGQAYSYSVTAVNTAGESPQSNVLNITAPVAAPAAPVLTDGTASGGTNPVIDWTAVPGATSYQISSSTDSGMAGATVIAGNVTGTTYTDSASSNGTFYYTATASNAAGPSAVSNILEITVPHS